jgi:hypothetical protein
VLVLQHLVRLTAWDHQMLLQETPPEFLALLGEQPGFNGLPNPEPYPPPPKPPALLPPPAAAAAAGDEAMADAECAAGDKDGEDDAVEDATAAAAPDDAMQQDEQQQEAAEKSEQEEQQQQDGDQAMQEAGDGQQAQKLAEPPADPEMVWAGKLLGVMQARPPPQHKPLSYEQVLEWVDQQQVGRTDGHHSSYVLATEPCCKHGVVYPCWVWGALWQPSQQLCVHPARRNSCCLLCMLALHACFACLLCMLALHACFACLLCMLVKPCLHDVVLLCPASAVRCEPCSTW